MVHERPLHGIHDEMDGCVIAGRNSHQSLMVRLDALDARRTRRLVGDYSNKGRALPLRALHRSISVAIV